jgi:hypothetical protein
MRPLSSSVVVSSSFTPPLHTIRHTLVRFNLSLYSQMIQDCMKDVWTRFKLPRFHLRFILARDRKRHSS